MNEVHDIMYSIGRRDALELNTSAFKMTGTQIIASEHCVPAFNPEKDYSEWPVGAPVADDDQVWTLIQPHNAKDYDGRPATLRALWGLAHTTDPKRAKLWVDPFGTSGMYMKDECYKDEGGIVFRCKNDNTIHDSVQLPDGWIKVIFNEEG